jgi:hypothetical protein
MLDIVMMAAKIINASARILPDEVNIVTGRLDAETLDTVPDYSCPYPVRPFEEQRRLHQRRGSDQGEGVPKCHFSGTSNAIGPNGRRHSRR